MDKEYRVLVEEMSNTNIIHPKGKYWFVKKENKKTRMEVMHLL